MYENYFYESYKKHLSKNYKLICEVIPQVCSSGEFASDGFDRAMYRKVQIIIDNIDINDKNILVFSDCDIQFFSNLEFDINNFDILFQKDFYENARCAGFFIAKQNKKVLDFFISVKSYLEKNMNGKIDDQYVINHLISNNEADINHSYLPSNKYWTVGNETLGKVWNGEDIKIPTDIIMHHANFTIGIDNKLKLLEIVKKENIRK